ncbi:Spy/CpxP family protein refolding chaperone [Enterovirga rhinocerotis]|uniref:LTXXQ motif family protein n=1 Tax=Enterovirga rhinocerotis TaxID=1339210 RepID=A0A4R7C1H3_9HYPH|nr:Spy/CpxP family protein refolding chaperone [Enterovirga rhinocerotis]TDR90236.1 LTXXQ motif family protein [Enterovirga rhinocerotis]
MLKITLPAVVFAVAALGVGVAQAQTQPAPQQQPAPTIVELHTAEDSVAVLDARLAALKTVIGIKPDQDKLWAPVEAAIRQVAKNAADRRAQRAKAAQPTSFVDILERSADAEAARAADLKIVASALKPLVASLSEAQQRRIPAFLGLREGRYGMPQPSAELWIFEDES